MSVATFKNNNITLILSPVEIQEAFETLKRVVVQTKNLQEERKALLQELAVMKADYAQKMTVEDPKWNFGKNDTERDALTRALFPTLTGKIDDIDLKLMENSENTAIARIEIERIQTLISYFRTVEIE